MNFSENNSKEDIKFFAILFWKILENILPGITYNHDSNWNILHLNKCLKFKKKIKLQLYEK